MPFEGEDPPHWEPDEELNALSKQVIGAALEVHKRLGAGLDEQSYHSALAIELRLREIDFQEEVWIDVEYKGQIVGKRRLDFLVAGRLIVETKAVQELIPLFSAQVYTYLKLMRLELGLLLNFDVPYLKDGIKRIVRPNAIP
jgi:GxxExxY protein